jgi:2-polyprenyl-3-methyl-5-hydroxy-6-metoxy-1,4-benzoquinol methylase
MSGPAPEIIIGREAAERERPDANRCLLCESARRKTIYAGQSGKGVHMCLHCGFICATPHRNRNQTREFLQKDYPSADLRDLDLTWQRPWLLQRAERRRDFLNEQVLLPKAARILDVGCYLGHFLYVGRLAGWRMEGIEPHPQVAAFARQQSGVVVHDCFLEEFIEITDEKFDAICLFHVLEHLEDPVNLVSVSRKLISDTGYICVEVPNAESCGRGDWQRFFDADDTHLWFFSRRSLGVLLTHAGYRVTKSEIVPGHSGKKGSILALARPSAESRVPKVCSRMVASASRFKLQLFRWNWRFGVGPAFRIIRRWRNYLSGALRRQRKQRYGRLEI